MATSLAEALQQKQTQLTDTNHRYNSNRSNGYRNVGEKSAKRITRADLPEWLQPAVQNDSWAARYKKLLDEAPAELRALVIYAIKNARSIYNYMNTACSKANWVGTLKKWRKSLTVERCAREVFKRIPITQSQRKAVYAACWRLGEGVIKRAVDASELGRNKFKFFCWLVWVGTEPQKSK